MTFDEYQALPDPPGHYYELHHGELCAMANPKFPHVRAQNQLHRLLLGAAGDSGIVHIEMPYRPLPDHEAWRADVVYISKARWNAIEDYLFGAPELVIEVLSPSNTVDEINEKRDLCLKNGSREFWVVDTKRREVTVSTPDGHSIVYETGQEIPLFFGGSLSVDAIFA
jgi:Uma2 family endonuclease